MLVPSERTPLGRVFLGVIAFAIFAPIGLAAVPLVALGITVRPRTRAAVGLLAVSAVIAVWWLAIPGELPEQTMRATAVLGAVVFATTTRLTRWSVTHRVLVALTVAGVAVIAFFAAFGLSWNELSWLVAHRVGFELRSAIAMMMGKDTAFIGKIEPVVTRTINWVSHLFPALLALQFTAACVLAVTLLRRAVPGAVGRPPGRLRDFRFSEHLGWFAAVPLVAVLLVRAGAIPLVAGNLLLVMGSLYALRGIAVVAFVLTTIGAGALVYLAAAVAVIFMLPVVAGGAIVLGVLDTGLDFRRRWLTPAAGE